MTSEVTRGLARARVDAAADRTCSVTGTDVAGNCRCRSALARERDTPNPAATTDAPQSRASALLLVKRWSEVLHFTLNVAQSLDPFLVDKHCCVPLQKNGFWA